MNKPRNHLFASAGLVILVNFFVLIGTRQGHTENPANVKVINTTSEPVPVTGNITLGGTSAVSGTVQAQQSGPWNVGINGIPTVKIDPVNNTVRVSANPTILVFDSGNVTLPSDGFGTTWARLASARTLKSGS
jgi:hypothetical protein